MHIRGLLFSEEESTGISENASFLMDVLLKLVLTNEIFHNVVINHNLIY